MSGPVGGRHPDGEPFVPYTEDTIKVQRLDNQDAIHAALNTYETTDRAPGVYDDGGMRSVVGANRRRLIIKEQLGGVWIGGCKVESGDDLRKLAALLLAMATELIPAEREPDAAFPTCFCGTGRGHPRGSGYYCGKRATA